MSLPRYRTVALVSCAILILAACSASQSNNTPAHVTAKPGGNLIFQFYAPPLDLDPATSEDNDTSMQMYGAWFQELVQTNSAETGFLPSLASSWTISPNGLTYTFYIRPDVKFSNGQPLTTADVVYSIKRNMQQTISTMYFLQALIANIQTRGSAVIITLHKPWPNLLAELAGPNEAIYPQNAFSASTAKAFFFQHPIGTGPFMLTKVVPNTSYTVIRNPYYWDKAQEPLLHSITFQIVTDDTTRATAVLGGRADIALDPPAPQVATYRRTSGVWVSIVPSSDMWLIVFNTKKYPFSNQKFREAISYAIDRKAIVQTGLSGYGQPATSFLVGPPSQTYQNPHLNLYPYNPALALRLMKQSGIRTPITIPFEVSTGTAQDAIYTVVQSGLAPLGIKLQSVVKDATSVDNDIIGEKFAMATTNWGNLDPDPSVEPLFSIDPSYCCAAYFTQYDNPSLIALTQKAVDTSNHAQAQQLFNQMQIDEAKDAPLLPLYYLDIIHLLSTKVAAFNINAYGLYNWATIGLAG
jgi:peptide/nickel transport system substrate-binding protein